MFPETIEASASPEVQMNANLLALQWAGCYAHDAQNDTGGLARAYSGGRWSGFVVADVVHTFGASTTTYVSVDRSDGTLDFSTSITHYNDSADYARVETVITGASTITSTVDDRGGPGGCHGGGTGGTPGISSDSVVVLRKQAAFVDSLYGDDATGLIDDMAFPFETIDAALDAAGNENVGVFCSRGRFAPITCDLVAGTATPLNGSSKLGSNISLIGSGRPSPDSATAPTTLDENTGTVIEGNLAFHSTRHNIVIENLGIDSGSAVCTARYAGSNDIEGLGFFNIGQVGSLAQSRYPRVSNVVVLTKTACTGHAVALENLIYPTIDNVISIGAVHGFAIKTVGGRFSNLESRLHSGNCFIIKESNHDNDTAPCHDNVFVNLVCEDAPSGIIFETASTRPVERIQITNVVMRSIGTQELLTRTTASSGTPGLVQFIRIDGLSTDNGPIRTSLASVDKASFFVNGEPVDGVRALTDGATINTDADQRRSSGIFSVAPAASGRTLANPTNLISGKTYVWLVDTTAGDIGTYGSAFDFYTATTASGLGVDAITAVYDGTKLRATYTQHL
jgi:hypothetical protein